MHINKIRKAHYKRTKFEVGNYRERKLVTYLYYSLNLLLLGKINKHTHTYKGGCIVGIV